MKEKTELLDYLIRTLEEMGCRCERDEKFNLVYFDFKQYVFRALVSDELNAVSIFCDCWEVVDLSDIDGIMRMKEAINVANKEFGTATYYTTNYDEHEFQVSSFRRIYFSPLIENGKAYLYNVLDDFIDVQVTVEVEFEVSKKK